MGVLYPVRPHTCETAFGSPFEGVEVATSANETNGSDKRVKLAIKPTIEFLI
jgi:hypothetical protein